MDNAARPRSRPPHLFGALHLFLCVYLLIGRRPVLVAVIDDFLLKILPGGARSLCCGYRSFRLFLIVGVNTELHIVYAKCVGYLLLPRLRFRAHTGTSRIRIDRWAGTVHPPISEAQR